MPQTGRMRVGLKQVLDCEPEAAWDAIRSPRVLRELYAPALALEPLADEGFPEFWRDGDELPCRVSALWGTIPLGEQTVAISIYDRGDARILEDHGGPTSGALGLVRTWRHRMAVSPAPGGGTLYRDRLDFSAGVLSAAAWPVLWSAWQGRGARIRQLASTWKPTTA